MSSRASSSSYPTASTSPPIGTSASHSSMNAWARSAERLATATTRPLPLSRIAFQFLRAIPAVLRKPQRQPVSLIAHHPSARWSFFDSPHPLRRRARRTLATPVGHGWGGGGNVGRRGRQRIANEVEVRGLAVFRDAVGPPVGPPPAPRIA